MSLYCAGSSYDENIIEYDLFYEEFGYQYFTSNVTPDGFECLRDSFLGAYRTEDNPIAVEHGTCSGSHELGNNHCGSLQKDLVLAPRSGKKDPGKIFRHGKCGCGVCTVKGLLGK